MKRIRNFSKNLFLNNFFVKLFCLFLAVLLWLVVMDYENPVVTREIKGVKYEIHGLEELNKRGIIIENVDKKTVDITIKGTWNNVMSFKPDDIKSYIDVGDYNVGKASINVISVVNDIGVSIKESKPLKINVVFDEVVEREKNIKVVLDGKVKEGLKVEKFDSFNKKIMVRGPLNRVNKIVHLEAKINIDKKEKSFIENVELVAKDSKGEVLKNIDIKKSVLDIYVPIYIEKNLPVEVKTKGKVSKDYGIFSSDTEPASIKVKIDTDKYKGDKKLKTEVIDVTNKQISFKKEVSIEQEDGLTFLDKSNVKVFIKIEPKETRKIKIPVDKITFVGKNSEYDYKVLFDKKEVVLNIIDVTSNIAKIKDNDFTLEIDLKNKEKGKHKVPIIVKQNGKLNENANYKIEPKNVFVEIK